MCIVINSKELTLSLLRCPARAHVCWAWVLGVGCWELGVVGSWELFGVESWEKDLELQVTPYASLHKLDC